MPKVMFREKYFGRKVAQKFKFHFKCPFMGGS